VRVGCARLYGVHSLTPFLWAGSRGVGDSRGAIHVLDNISKIQDNTANVNICPQKESKWRSATYR
jgi:hypothetical protein